jgi:hypothetical protein
MKVGSPLIPSSLRLGLTLVIVLMVISSPVVMLVNPALLAASSPGGGYDVTTYAPSTISQGGSDFTAQAALLGPATFRSTDLVSSTAIYEIQFITTTTGVIDKIDITFPAGTGVALAGIIERVGIGPGALTKSGSTVTFDLHTPVSIPAGTFIRLEMVDISNPPNPANYKISVTTKDPSNIPIDGPSLSPAYTIRQVSSGMVAQSFMKRVTLLDNPAGNALGWDPDNVDQSFTISEPAISSDNSAFISIEVRDQPGAHSSCDVVDHSATTKTFSIECEQPVDGGIQLHYVVENLPPHVP